MNTSPSPATSPSAGRARVVKAVIPAAGRGTRFLPATKSVPKELFPIVDKPVLQYVVEEAVASGIEDVLIVTSGGKGAIEKHFGRDAELEAFLRESKKEELIGLVRDIGGSCRISFVLQPEQRGLGDAIRHARDHVGGEPFAVLLGDTIIDPAPGSPPGLRQLLSIWEERRASVVAVQRVPREWVRRYGIVDGEEVTPDLLRLRRLVEKPDPDAAPSDCAIAGRYVLTPAVFDHLERTGPGVGGEIQLTDAINQLAATEPVFALAWKARRHDIGDRIEYVKCFIELAMRRPDTAGAVREHARRLLDEPEPEE